MIEKIQKYPTNKKDIINIFGDICLEGIKINEFLYGPKLLDDIKNSYNIGNLECVLTNSKIEKELQTHILRPNIKDAPYYLKHFKILSLANNHIQDFLDKGCKDTINLLDSLCIKHFGVGRTYEKAISPLCFNVNSNKIAIIGSTRYANTKRGNIGTAKEKLYYFKKIIKELKNKGYIVLIYFHWGYLYQRIPAPRERHIAHKCIDYGADLIIGSHSHIFQSHETYKGKEIWYGLGNFIFHPDVAKYLAEKPNDNRLFNSFYLKIQINESNITNVKPVWYTINRNGVELISDNQYMTYYDELERISTILNKQYYKYWKAYYSQASKIAKQSKKMRSKFQLSKNHDLKSIIKVYTDFNFQDFKNRLAALFDFLFLH